MTSKRSQPTRAEYDAFDRRFMAGLVTCGECGIRADMYNGPGDPEPFRAFCKAHFLPYLAERRARADHAFKTLRERLRV